MSLSSPHLALVPLDRWYLDGAAGLHADGEVALGVCDRRVALLETRRWTPRGELAASARAAAFVGHEAWVIDERCGLVRHDLRGVAIGAPVPLPPIPRGARLSVARSGAGCLLVDGVDGFALHRADDRVIVAPLPPFSTPRAALGPRAWVERRGATLAVHRGGRLDVIALPDELATADAAQAAALGDTTVAVELRGARRHAVVVLDLVAGTIATRIGLEDVIGLVFAERRALAIASRADGVTAIDLRRGRVLAAGPCAPVIAVDGQARVAVLAGDGDAPDVVPDLLAMLASRVRRAVEGPPPPAVAPIDPARAAPIDPPAIAPIDPAIDPPAIAAPIDPPAIAAPIDPPAIDAPIAPPTVEPPPVARLPAPRADGPPPLRALGTPRPPGLAADEHAAYVADALALLHAFAATAAVPDGEDRDLHRAAEVEAARGLAVWNRPGTPHIELARGLALSPLATTILLVVAGPALDPELDAAYRALAPRTDAALVARLLEADRATQLAIAAELDAAAPLRRTGAVVTRDGALACHPLVVQRLLGAALAVPPPGALRRATRALDELHLAAGVRAAIAALAAPGPAPLRLALRGRPGAGRRTTAAALAATVGRDLADLELAALADRTDPIAALAAHLAAAVLVDAVPCLGLDGLDDDPVLRRRVRAVLDAHPGPLVVRAPAGAALPLAPGHVALELETLPAAARTAVWEAALAAAGRPTAAAPRLAARYRVGPGTVAAVVARAAGADDDALEAALVEGVRQHRAGRLRDVATRVDRLAAWEDLVLPDEHHESLRELLARVRCAAAVLDGWGLGRIVTTGRGDTALFQGGPGTGKTMAAGVIARELGFELWRVDLSRVVSKWAGETEKNLAAVFDAAEDGEVALLFDEADALFGKRTDVRSSHDRHANLEVNYLLQRLDTFEGLAILTTNFGTAIDPAFRRRFAVQLQLGFPDEDDRLRLWQAHLPPSVPTGGDLDLAALARGFAMSGGAIRNAVLRAAYRAAAAGGAITDAGLRAAIAAEYRDRGQVSTTAPLA